MGNRQRGFDLDGRPVGCEGLGGLEAWRLGGLEGSEGSQSAPGYALEEVDHSRLEGVFGPDHEQTVARDEVFEDL
jgi:hypothetical protein